MLPEPYFRTLIVIHGGVSGGSMFDDHGNVFAIDRTGLEGEPISYVSYPLAPRLGVRGN